MASLVGVHAPEMQRAISLEAELIGINNRDLATLEIDLATTERLSPMAPGERLLVSDTRPRTCSDDAARRALLPSSASR
jgi:indole-3-glycerol phosphate synthase